MGSNVVVGGTLIDSTGSDPIENAVIMIENERIKEIGRKDEVSIPQGAQTIDAEGKMILPHFTCDLLIVDDDTLRDIKVLQDPERIKLVIKNGQIIVDRR